MSTHMSSPPRFTFLASQNCNSRASMTPEHLPDFMSEKNSPNCHNNTIQYIRGGWLTNKKDSHIYTDFPPFESRDRRIEDLIVGVWIDENKYTKTITYSVSDPWRRWRVIVAVKRIRRKNTDDSRDEIRVSHVRFRAEQTVGNEAHITNLTQIEHLF